MNAPYRPTVADRIVKRAIGALLTVPSSVRYRLAGPAVIEDGAPLNSDVAMGLKILRKIDSEELETKTIPNSRKALEAEAWTFSGVPAEVESVETVTIPSGQATIEALVYYPKPQPFTVTGKFAGVQKERARAAVVYFHGGGWTLGSHRSHDPVARALCAQADVIVINVNYRLAPEGIFPAAVEDAVATFDWAVHHADELGIDPKRIAVAGDSAGGNLAAVVSQKTVRRGGPHPAMQVLVVPATDLTRPHSDSYARFKEGYFLTEATMDWYEALYLGGQPTPIDGIDELRANPDVSPLKAADLAELAKAGLPPAFVACAGFDPLRDEGIAYAEALREAGVPTALRVFTDNVHPFINSLAAPASKACISEIAGAIRMGLQA